MSHHSAVNKLICIEFASQLHKDFLSPSFNCLKQRTSICAASHLHVSTLFFLQLPYKAITWILSKRLQFSHILKSCARWQSACWRSNDGPIKFQPDSTVYLFKVFPKCPTLPPPKKSHNWLMSYVYRRIVKAHFDASTSEFWPLPRCFFGTKSDHVWIRRWLIS